MGLDDRDYMRERRLRGLDEYPARSRRDRSTLEHVLDATVESQLGALVFGTMGVLLASRVPHAVLDALTPGRQTDNPYIGIMGNAYVGTGYILLPWVRVFGFVLILVAAISLVSKGHRPSYRRRIRSAAGNNAAAGALAIALLLEFGSNPPHLLPGNREIAEMAAKTEGRTLGPERTAATGARFPASGTTQWGAEGEPIGGNLEQLQIWDVTGSPQNKVVAVRSGLVMRMPGVRTQPYAVVYVRAGDRVTLNLPANRPYTVVATSGDAWMGPDAMFGDTATTVDFGQVMLMAGRPGVIAMGAPDQTANVVPNDRF